uniref:Histone H1.X n=1 Tax=Ascaris suum TaxID=6253 RepID=F1L351_ASCSU
MSAQVAAASPIHAPKKSPKKASKPKSAKVVASHPTYSVMIKAALVALKDHKGSSRAAILKYILQHYKVGDNINKVNAHLRQALKKGASSGFLKQVKGVGASGSFRLGEKKAEVHKKVKKPTAKKAHTVKSPKAAAAKKPAKARKKVCSIVFLRSVTLSLTHFPLPSVSGRRFIMNSRSPSFKKKRRTHRANGEMLLL